MTTMTTTIITTTTTTTTACSSWWNSERTPSCPSPRPSCLAGDCGGGGEASGPRPSWWSATPTSSVCASWSTPTCFSTRRCRAAPSGPNRSGRTIPSCGCRRRRSRLRRASTWSSSRPRRWSEAGWTRSFPASAAAAGRSRPGTGSWCRPPSSRPTGSSGTNTELQRGATTRRTRRTTAARRCCSKSCRPSNRTEPHDARRKNERRTSANPARIVPFSPRDGVPGMHTDDDYHVPVGGRGKTERKGKPFPSPDSTKKSVTFCVVQRHQDAFEKAFVCRTWIDPARDFRSSRTSPNSTT
mmetsp:Transcript_193/g.489  ORF Transcript_193/g.489 Transcript_193/m.489 type:complete len:298 (-) Transcript_193:33-926(-)